MLIQVNDLGYVYSAGTPLARSALDGINVGIGPGERVGLLGATGAGKSTLVQLMAGLLSPTHGQVLLDGRPAGARGAAARALRLRIGLAFQYPEQQIFEQTVRREIGFGPRNQGLAAEEVAARVSWALEMVGLEPGMAERIPLALSGGEMRRVALAGVLAMRPEVLILDEPGAGLDPQGRRELMGRVLSWQQSSGATLILIGHNLDEMARLVDRVILLAPSEGRGGRIAADGPAGEILTDASLLRAAGLDAPQTVGLLLRLREGGLGVRTDRLLMDDVAAEIERACRGRLAPRAERQAAGEERA